MAQILLSSTVFEARGHFARHCPADPNWKQPMQLLTGPPVIAVALVAIAAIASPAHATITLTALISRGAQALLDFFGKYEPQPDSGIGTTLALFGAGLLDTVCSAVGAAISTL